MAPHREELIRVGVFEVDFFFNSGQNPSIGVVHHGDEDVLHLGPSGYFLVPLREGAESRFLLGEFAEALAAADNAKALHAVAAGQIQFLDYCHYAWLTAKALYESASADEQTGRRNLLTAPPGTTARVGGSSPLKFADECALVSAEIARIEGRDFDAMQLYEQAIAPQACIENTVFGRLH